MVEFKPMSQEEIKRLAQAKKQKEREKRELEQMNRKHLANMRVVQKNLVYVVGMDPKLAREELIPTLRSNEYFGQYGRISKILISKRTTASKLVMGTQESSIGVYVTYVRKEDAARAIIAIDGSKGSDGRTIRASYGTTKYCTTYLRNLPCANPICTYLHEPGEEADSFTKEDLTTLRHAAKDTETRNARAAPAVSSSFHSATRPHDTANPTSGAGATANGGQGTIGDSTEASALPKTASWASGKPMTAAPTSGQKNAIQDADLPPLSAIATQQQSRRGGLQRTPASPIVAKSPAKIRQQQNRPESPSLPRSATSSPVPAAPPGLAKAPVLARSGSALRHSPKQEESAGDEVVATEDVSSGNKAVSVPPGLVSRSATPSADTASSGSEPKTASVYQPSSNAQAVLDDMRARREAEAMQPSKSPFPDFEATLSSFRDGDDFCFTFEDSVLASQGADKASALGTPTVTPFASGPMYGGVLSAQSTSNTPPPPGLGAQRSAMPRTYSGSFDPFSSDNGEALLKGKPLESLGGMYNALMDVNSSKREDGEVSGEPGSRFGFAKRKEAFRTPDDLLGFVKAGALLGTQNNAAQQHPPQQPNFLSSGFAHPMNGAPNHGSEWSSGQGESLHGPATLSHFMPVQNNGQLPDVYRGAGNASPSGGADSILLAQLMNRKPNELSTYQSSPLASFARPQQLHQQQQSFSTQSPGNQNASFNPFELQSPYSAQNVHRQH
jgi:CCR4-NOT transcription complex subunit 4